MHLGPWPARGHRSTLRGARTEGVTPLHAALTDEPPGSRRELFAPDEWLTGACHEDQDGRRQHESAPTDGDHREEHEAGKAGRSSGSPAKPSVSFVVQGRPEGFHTGRTA